MAAKSPVWLLLVLTLLYRYRSWATLPELECPEDCECHYFRINWVTDCSESNLTEIPNDNMSLNVYVLNMNGNNVTTWPPFPPDMKLRRLQIADNFIQNVTRDMFQGLGYLLDVDLSGNNVSEIDPEAFKDSPGLITLEIQNNPLSHIDGPFVISQSLHYLDLSGCSLTLLSKEFFSGVPALNRLDLSDNPLGSLGAGAFEPLANLEYLRLNRCNLTYISETTFSKQEHLKTLELAGNFLSEVDWAVVSPLGRLETLDLRNADIMYLPEDVFANNVWLRNLIVADNILRELDVATTLGHNLRHLDYLDLSNCRLKGPLSEDAFANATKLRTLILSGNRLSASDLAVALRPLTKLQKLSLRNCSLHRLPDDTFHRFNELQELDLSNNPLQDAFTSLLNPLESLERLDMGYSNLGYISRSTFSKMTSLKTLILSGNPLNTLESGLFKNLTHLETLELNNCGLIRAINPMVFDNSTYLDLTELRLAGNPLNVSADSGPLLPAQLCRVQILDLSHCNLTVLPDDAFATAPNISRLLLAGNRLSSVGASYNELAFLKMVPQVEVLDMTYNNLSRLSPVVFRHNHHLTSVKLIGNPWKCDCSIAEMWLWAINWKGNLGVLAGSTLAPEEAAPGGAKRKKALLCTFIPKSSPLSESSKTWKRAREFIVSSNRTWAKYVRESGCEPDKTLTSARFARSVADQQELVGEPLSAGAAASARVAPNSPPFMSVALGGTLLIAVAMTVAYLLSRKHVIQFDVVKGEDGSDSSPGSSPGSDRDKRHGGDTVGDKAKQL